MQSVICGGDEDGAVVPVSSCVSSNPSLRLGKMLLGNSEHLLSH